MERSNSWTTGLADFVRALRSKDLWLFLGKQDIRQRYRRSVLGPFWVTISTGILVGTLGFLWSNLFGQKIESYLPFYAIGQVCWVFINGFLVEATSGFSEFESIIKQANIPVSSLLLRLLWRNVVIFLHNFLIIFLVITFVGLGWSIYSLLAIPGLFLMWGFCLFLSGPIAVICTRFRDMPLIVTNILTVLFFFTPIIWLPESMRHESWVYEYNPIFHIIQVVRAPLLGSTPTVDNYLWAVASLVLAAVAFVWIIGRTRKRIPYWL
jgi:lipopolysaccharide transport system permease protein